MTRIYIYECNNCGCRFEYPQELSDEDQLCYTCIEFEEAIAMEEAIAREYLETESHET